MKRTCLCLAVLGLLLAAPVASQAPSEGACDIQGTWYGFNTFGEPYIQTINRTGAKSYTSVAQGPSAPAPLFDFVIGKFSGFQGDLTRTARNQFDGTWLIMDWIDPTYDFDTDPFFNGAGCGTGWNMMALVVFGPVTMPTCDSWTTTFDLEFIAYSFGTDPFTDGCSLGNPFGLGQGFYQRLPQFR